MIDKDTAYQKIAQLVERFEEQYASYKNTDYNETLARRDFIDPFFKALQWDVDNSEGYAEAYREVIHEDKIKVEGSTKAPDYAFRLPGGKKLFFVEAKKPSIYIKDAMYPAYQVRRYGWSANLGVSVVTDFEEFAIYDCTRKPSQTDNASNARIKYITYKDYLKEFDFIWDTFSKEKVLKGSFDKFVSGTANKRGTSTVDKEFLLSLDNWRTIIAENIAKQNKELNEDEINFAVQQTIDRIIFLRIAEDRSVEPYGKLKEALAHGDYYQNLFGIFKEADQKYNSGLFDLKKDQICGGLKVDNRVLKTVINELYYPVSPYQFSELPVEIIGSAYEQFLGKQIKIDSRHRAVIELKPEVRKAGGVYYTPQYIVNYIVEHTVGKLIEGKAPKEVSSVKIVDPACGSGSFLIGAYDYLMDWHKKYYLDKGLLGSNKKDSPLTPAGELTSGEKKRILLNNIYGVDLDSNAVEVTKLSLLLKCMEGETNASISYQFSMFNERILPTLESNIKSGNSLIDTDYYDTQIDFGEEKKIKPFNWQRAFPEVFSQGGFDAVIGNPPYVRQELLGKQKEYFQKKYKVYHGMADLYSYFIEKSIQLLKPTGLYGVIVANKWMRANYGEPLRKYLKQQSIYEITDFGDLPVFETATTYPCILLVGHPRSVNDIFQLTNVHTLKFYSLQEYIGSHKTAVTKSLLDDSGWNLAGEEEQNLLNKLTLVGIPLSKYVNGKVFRGIITGLNEAFVIDSKTRENLISEDANSSHFIKPFLIGREVKRYKRPVGSQYIILFPKGYTKKHIATNEDPFQWLQANYPALAKHLLPHKEKAEKRLDKGDFWWELRACDYYPEFEKTKIIYPNILKQPEFTYDQEGWYTNQKCFIISIDDKYLLGLLNSKLNNYLFEKYLPKLRGGFYEPSYVFFKNFPIKQVDFSDVKEKQLHELIVSKVDELLYLNENASKLSTVNDVADSKRIYLENKINEAVYELYNLTEDEIRIVEGNTNASTNDE